MENNLYCMALYEYYEDTAVSKTDERTPTTYVKIPEHYRKKHSIDMSMSENMTNSILNQI